MFNAKGILLQQEGHLFHSCLTVGLTALMTANLDRKGDFYSAFFQLSIGLERAMKVVIIIEHMATNQLKAPTKSQIQSYGHDLIQLSYCISRIFEIVSSLYELLRCVTRYAQAVDSESEKELSSIPFMEEFLEFARYPDPELWPILK